MSRARAMHQRLDRLGARMPVTHCPCCRYTEHQHRLTERTVVEAEELFARYYAGEDFTAVLDEICARRGPDPWEGYVGPHCACCTETHRTPEEEEAAMAAALAFFEERAAVLAAIGITTPAGRPRSAHDTRGRTGHDTPDQ